MKSDPIGFSRIDRKHHGHDNIAYEPHCDDCDESPFCKIRTFPREYVGYQYESEECDNFSCDTTDKRKLTFESCLEECKNRTIDQSKECKNTRNTYTNECNVTVVSWKKECYEESNTNNCNSAETAYGENISRDFSNLLFISFTYSSCYLPYCNGIEPHVGYGCKY
ncbi:hypothetical protein KC711_06845 [Candidatus Peregrinibacteria bacterium]|nr:hypothetical protein [Candidatus Peregrinibacteria bacterium]MCB9804063.1 hypothetical protein [Candidatus Peribacteria bacterium]